MQHLRAMSRFIFELLFARAVASTKVPRPTCRQQHRANRFTLALQMLVVIFGERGSFVLGSELASQLL
jgi:hypothetical protein